LPESDHMEHEVDLLDPAMVAEMKAMAPELAMLQLHQSKDKLTKQQKLWNERHEQKERLWRIAGIFHGYSDFEPALVWYQKALKYWEQFSTDDEDIAVMTFAIGTIYKVLSQWETARELFGRSLKIKKRIYESDSPSIALCERLYQEAQDEVHDWEISKNMYSAGAGEDDPPGPGSWIHVGPFELDLSESEMDPENPRYTQIP